MSRFEILPGLPPYGPMPEQFSATGQGQHREGVAVRLETASGGSWVGNFQRGLTRYDQGVAHPDARRVLIVAGGQGYIVDPETKAADLCGGAIVDVLRFEDLLILNHQHIQFEALGHHGREWLSQRLSWDGFRELRVEGATLRGLAWGPGEPEWVAFELDLRTGVSHGGQQVP